MNSGGGAPRSHSGNNFGENKMAFKAENLQQQLDSQDFGGRWEDKENKSQKPEYVIFDIFCYCYMLGYMNCIFESLLIF